jgi:hypothetical protein
MYKQQQYSIFASVFCFVYFERFVNYMIPKPAALVSAVATFLLDSIYDVGQNVNRNQVLNTTAITSYCRVVN